VVGASLTMASIAVLPVLIGLAVDYAIQLQARVQEAQAAGAGIEAAVARTATRGAPTVATAAAATAAGFLVLALSPVPMVRGFGLLLVAGIALALGCALTLGVAALAASARFGHRRPVLAGLAPAWRGAGELIASNRAALAVRARGAAAGRGALRLATAHPGRVVLVALVVALAGWGLETQTRVESDLTKLVPQNGAIRDLQALQRSTDVGGEIDVVVSGGRVTDPAVVKWMTSCVRPSRCLTSSRAARTRRASRSRACSTRCRRTSRRASSRPTGARPRWPSGSASCRSTARSR
jgi:predicted RND superfamily exporter protein